MSLISAYVTHFRISIKHIICLIDNLDKTYVIMYYGYPGRWKGQYIKKIQ